MIQFSLEQMETIRHVRSLHPLLVSSRNTTCGEERCVTTPKGRVADYHVRLLAKRHVFTQIVPAF